MSCLDTLRKHSIVVADSGDFETLKQFTPTDATTNPSLILSACKMPQYQELFKSVVKNSKDFKTNFSDEEFISLTIDKVFVAFGLEILKIIPGRVSTEVDARLSFDTKKQVERAISIIKLYENAGIHKDRVLIKLSSTWEGIMAAEILEREYKIHCNLTLLFSFYQAVACAQVGVTLISPFVGRIYDYYVSRGIQSEVDPGVKSVTQIVNYYRKFGLQTQIMAASFRNVDQIKALCGCDLLTIAPSLLAQLAADSDAPEERVKPRFSTESVARECDLKAPICLTEAQFRWELNQDVMATDKLAEGIRNFAADAVKLEAMIREVCATL